MNNNTIGYYSDIIQRSLILLGVFRHLKENSLRSFYKRVLHTLNDNKRQIFGGNEVASDMFSVPLSMVL